MNTVPLLQILLQVSYVFIAHLGLSTHQSEMQAWSLY